MQLRDQQRLEKIKEYCSDILATVRRCDDSFDTFKADRDYQRSISFCILQIGELVNGLTEEYRSATKDRVQWQQIKGMRNVVVHNYGSIDLQVVWDVATIDIPTLGRFCEEQLANEK